MYEDSLSEVRKYRLSLFASSESNCGLKGAYITDEIIFIGSSSLVSGHSEIPMGYLRVGNVLLIDGLPPNQGVTFSEMPSRI